MNRNPKTGGSGGRLRLGLLTATVAAFLLVPAAQAFAAPEGHIIIEGNGSGAVIGSGPTGGGISCHKPSEGGDVCDTALIENAGFFYLKVKHEQTAPNEFVEWIVEPEGAKFLCGATAAECAVRTTGEDVTIKAVFKSPRVHVMIAGNGSGEVVGSGNFNGNPALACVYDGETETQSGVCDTEPKTVFGVTAMKFKEVAAAGSEFVEWELIKGVESNPGTSCEPKTQQECGPIELQEGEIIVKATFHAIPTWALNVTTSSTNGGTGSYECEVESVVGPCQAEYLDGTEVTVIPSADEGSEFTGFTGDCSGGTCVMNEEHSVDLGFDLETRTLAVEVEGEGEITGPGIACDEEAKNGGPECEETFLYGTNVVLAVTAAGENVIGSLEGTESAAGECEFETATGSCEFSITEDSAVNAVFVAGNTIETQEENVHGEVPQTTELATSCENDVDFGEFTPGVAENYVKTCALTVTATGEVNTLTAADESLTDTGHLTQKPAHPYSLPHPLETKASGIPGLEFPGAPGSTSFTALTSPVTLLTYGGPVASDNVTLSLRQIIGLHDALHSGEYKKTITLTLKQTTL